MDEIVKWATILSPIIAVLIAWWTSRRGARDAAKQIESVKELTKLQIEITKVKLDKELWEAKVRCAQASERQRENSLQGLPVGGAWDSIHQREETKKNITDKQSFYSQQVEMLQNCLKRIEDLSNNRRKK